MALKIRKGGFQDRFLHARERYVAGVTGYGGGKSYIGCRKALLLSQENAPCLGLIVSHSWEQQETVVIPEFTRMLEDLGISYTFHKSEHRLDLPWASVIFRPGSKPIVGHTVAWAWIDEAALCPDTAWKDVLARVRDHRAKHPQIALTSTPEGCRGFLYKHFVEKPLGDCTLITGSTLENTHLHEAYVSSLEDAYDPTLQKAYIHGQFVDFNSLPAYYAFSRDTHITSSWMIPTPHGAYNLMEPEPNLELIVSFDFGVEVATCVVLQRSGAGQRTQIRVLDEVWLQNSNTFECVEEFVRKWGNKGFKLRVHGDAAGSTTSSSSASQSDYDVIRKLCTGAFSSVSIDVPKANSKVVDRLNTVNSVLHGSDKVMLRIHPRCEKLIKDLVHTSLTQDGSRRIDKKKNSELSHVSDALGYALQKMPNPLQEFNKLRVWS